MGKNKRNLIGFLWLSMLNTVPRTVLKKDRNRHAAKINKHRTIMYIQVREN